MAGSRVSSGASPASAHPKQAGKGRHGRIPRLTARDPLPSHSTLLLYTDGLIERRGEPLDDSLARLRRHAAALAQAPLDVFCDELIIRLGAGNDDDIAVLALRPAAPD